MHSTKPILIFAAGVLAIATMPTNCHALPLRFPLSKCAIGDGNCLRAEELSGKLGLVEPMDQLQSYNLLGFPAKASWPTMESKFNDISDAFQPRYSQFNLDDSITTSNTRDISVSVLLSQLARKHRISLGELLDLLLENSDTVSSSLSSQIIPRRTYRLKRRNASLSSLIDLNSLNGLNGLSLLHSKHSQKRRGEYDSFGDSANKQDKNNPIASVLPENNASRDSENSENTNGIITITNEDFSLQDKEKNSDTASAYSSIPPTSMSNSALASTPTPMPANQPSESVQTTMQETENDNSNVDTVAEVDRTPLGSSPISIDKASMVSSETVKKQKAASNVDASSATATTTLAPENSDASRDGIEAKQATYSMNSDSNHMDNNKGDRVIEVIPSNEIDAFEDGDAYDTHDVNAIAAVSTRKSNKLANTSLNVQSSGKSIPSDTDILANEQNGYHANNNIQQLRQSTQKPIVNTPANSIAKSGQPIASSVSASVKTSDETREKPQSLTRSHHTTTPTHPMDTHSASASNDNKGHLDTEQQQQQQQQSSPSTLQSAPAAYQIDNHQGDVLTHSNDATRNVASAHSDRASNHLPATPEFIPDGKARSTHIATDVPVNAQNTSQRSPSTSAENPPSNPISSSYAAEGNNAQQTSFPGIQIEPNGNEGLTKPTSLEQAFEDKTSAY